MNQIEALIISISIGLFVGMLFPQLRMVKRCLLSPEARRDLGVALGIFLSLNIGPLIFDGAWLNRAEEEVGRIEIFVISSLISGFFLLLSIYSERKARK